MSSPTARSVNDRGPSPAVPEEVPSPPPPPLVKGYPKLAERMGLIPEMAAFRKFATLNAQNLLYLQAELTELEKELREKEDQDSQRSEDNRCLYSRDWYWLGRSAREDDEQLRIFLRIRETLKEYSKPLSCRTSLRKSLLDLQMPRFSSNRTLRDCLNQVHSTSIRYDSTSSAKT